ncbi:MAG: hypothetical protein RJQ07_05850 [Pseudomonadales bacterium]
METSRIAHWLQIIGNFGILGGLLLVGVQINQNNQIAGLDFRGRSFEQVAQYQLAMMAENPSRAVAKAATNPSELTDEELLVLRRIFSFWINVDSLTEMRIREGFANQELAESYWRKRAEDLYGANPVWAAIWQDYKKSAEVEFRWMTVVDQHLRQVEHNADEKLLERLRTATQSEP